MEVDGGRDRKLLVASYELIGTAIFVYMIIVSTGDPFAVPLALFSMIVIFGGITGGHFNPAVTLGVYIHEGKWVENAPFALIIMCAQLVGSMLAMLVAFCVLGFNREEDRKFVVGKHRVPILAP